MLRVISFCLCLIFSCSLAYADNGGHHITIKMDNYPEKEMYLAGYIGETPYILDTVQVQNNEVIFKGDDTLEDGVYIIVMPPDNRFIQIFVDKDNQNFTLQADYNALGEQKFKVNGSQANELFYTYVGFLTTKGPEAQAIKQELETASAAGQPTENLENKLDQINKDVKAYQKSIIANHPSSPVATWIKFSQETPIPEFEGHPDTVGLKRYLFRKAHYFDNVNFADSSLYRNPMLEKKVNYYIEKLTVPMPDSIINSLDYILEKTSASPKVFRFYLSKFINKYAEEAQTRIGMDGVYVHIVDNYYARGRAPWVEEEQLEKIKTEAARRRPTLIGRKAMNINMRKEDGSRISLYDIESPYIVMYFWRFDCSHCKKSTPKMVEFAKKFKDRGVTMVGTCVKMKEKDMEECWKYVHDKDMDDWINVVDPGNKSKFTAKYDTRTTPRIFILDKDKNILINRASSEQLEEIMEDIIRRDNEKK